MSSTTAQTIIDRPPQLLMEAAIAARVIRSGKLPRKLFQWLNAPSDFQACDLPGLDNRIGRTMAKILDPLLVDARQWEQKEARYAANWLSAVCSCAMEHAQVLELGIGSRMLVAGLLPLYRSLATGNLHDGFLQSRCRLSEMLTLLALCHEVGEDLVAVLESHRDPEPQTVILQRDFGLDLTQVAFIVREQVTGFDSTKSCFTQRASGALLRFDRSQLGPSIAEWAAPELLWRLAGELMSKNAKLILPRSWVETPVPWSSIGEHWQELSALLSNPGASRDETSAGFGLVNSPADRVTAATSKPDNGFRDTAVVAAIEQLTLEHTRADAAQATGAPTTTVDASATPARDVRHAANRRIENVVIAKMLIAEVRTHNDPVFANFIRRQIAVCRADERTISLASITVQPENEADHLEIHSSRENGLTLWQQKLVNWLVDHPHVHEPQAFLTSTGELLLCLMDLERNEATTLLRHGLVEVLSGEQVTEDSGNALAKVNVPARYHAGIASTSSPGAGFTPEQLIEPAVRCLSAASRQGKAAIKSIEVY